MPKKKAARKSAGPKPADGQSAKRKAGASAAASANSQKGRPGQTSKHRGVSWEKARSKWVAKIRRNGVTKKLGRFAEEEEADRDRGILCYLAAGTAGAILPQLSQQLNHLLPLVDLEQCVNLLLSRAAA